MYTIVVEVCFVIAYVCKNVGTVLFGMHVSILIHLMCETKSQNGYELLRFRMPTHFNFDPRASVKQSWNKVTKQIWNFLLMAHLGLLHRPAIPKLIKKIIGCSFTFNFVPINIFLVASFNGDVWIVLENRFGKWFERSVSLILCQIVVVSMLYQYIPYILI